MQIFLKPIIMLRDHFYAGITTMLVFAGLDKLNAPMYVAFSTSIIIFFLMLIAASLRDIARKK